MTFSRIWGVLALALPLFAFAAGQADARRVALVIGNDDYLELPTLQKAAADATDFAAVLEDKDFDEVLLHKNLTRLEMDLAVSEFLETINPGDTAVFFYSGHGWSDGLRNFLVGTDVPKGAGGVALTRLSLPLQNGANGLIDSMSQQGASLKIVIVDACRDNPFAPSVAGRSAGIERGLARVQPPNGTFVIFSAGTGQTALDRLSDDDDDRNSVFSRTFLPLVRSDLPLVDVIKSTQEKVYELARTVRHEQEPAYYDQVRGDACLSLSCQMSKQPVAAKPQSAEPTLDRDVRFWIAIERSEDPAAYRTFLELYPTSDLATLADVRIETLEAGYFGKALESGRDADLERYLAIYPDGKHADEARSRLAAMRQIVVEPAPAPTAAGGEATEQAAGESATAPAESTPATAEPAAAETAETPPPEVEVALAKPEEPAPEAEPAGPAALSGPELIVAVQEVLKRAGCYTSSIDGLWGRRSQNGLEDLLRRREINLAAEPTADVLARIQDVNERVCPEIKPAPQPPRRTKVITRRQPNPTPAPVVHNRLPPPPPPQHSSSFGSGGNPRAGCANILSPADPNFGAPGDRRGGAC